MMEHIHGCLTCRPDMVPDFSRDDPRYHIYVSSSKCASAFRVLVDGIDVGYTQGAFEGPEGWALVAGADVEKVHDCPNCTADREYQGYQVADRQRVCVEPRFGRVVAQHEGAC